MNKIINYTTLTLIEAVKEKKIVLYGIQKLYEELYEEYKDDIKVLKILYYSSINLEDLTTALEVSKEKISKLLEININITIKKNKNEKELKLDKAISFISEGYGYTYTATLMNTDKTSIMREVKNREIDKEFLKNKQKEKAIEILKSKKETYDSGHIQEVLNEILIQTGLRLSNKDLLKLIE